MKKYRVWKNGSEREEKYLSVSETIELQRQGYRVEQTQIGCTPLPGKDKKKKDDK